MGMASLHSSCQDPSVYVQRNLFESPRDSTSGQILILTFQGHIIHGSTRLDETNTMVSKELLDLE